jgi:hypothetical protein
MVARLFLATLLSFTAVACEKEIHEVRRRDHVPQSLQSTDGTIASANDEGF